MTASAGESSGGAAGAETGGSAGMPGGGEAGAMTGGSAGMPGGGAGGDMSPGAGGEGGAGPSTPTLAQNCATICTTVGSLDCSTSQECLSGCTTYTANGDATLEQYTGVINCLAHTLTTAGDYACSADGPVAQNQWYPTNADSSCEVPLCDWVCADQTVVNSELFDRCGC
jgi:hypothetical protein